MSEQRVDKAIERSCRLYQRLLVIYPRAHREEYGAAILQLFRDQCRDAWARAQSRGLMGFWLHALADLLKTSILEHLSNLNRSKSMLKYFRPQFRPLSVFFPIFGLAFFFVFVVSVVVTFIYPETFRSTTRILVKYVLADDTAAAMGRPDHSVMQVQSLNIRSHATLSKVSQALDLPAVWGKKYNNGQPLTESEVEHMLLTRLEVFPVRNSDIIEISAYSETPEEAAQIANKVAVSYREARSGQVKSSGTTPIERSVVIIDPAVPQGIAVRPNKPLNTVLGAMMGILVGLFVGTIGAGLIAAARKNRALSSALNS